MPHEGVNIMRLVNLNALYIDMQQHNADSMVFAAHQCYKWIVSGK